MTFDFVNFKSNIFNTKSFLSKVKKITIKSYNVQNQELLTQ